LIIYTAGGFTLRAKDRDEIEEKTETMLDMK